MKLAKAIREMNDGQILKITASDAGFSRDVPGWCAKTENELISLTSDKGIYLALVRRGKAGATVAAVEPIAASGTVAGLGSGDVNVDFYVNACGVPCPGPIMKLAKKIKAMEDGQVLKITASDAGFSKDVPGWCTKTGNDLISIDSDKGIYTALIRKGK